MLYIDMIKRSKGKQIQKTVHMNQLVKSQLDSGRQRNSDMIHNWHYKRYCHAQQIAQAHTTDECYWITGRGAPVYIDTIHQDQQNLVN